MKKFKSLIRTLPILMAIALGLILFIPAQQTFAATAKEDACAGVGAISGSNGGCTPSPGAPSVDTILITVINVLSLVIGFIAVVMVIIGGFRFVLSGGDSNQVNSARNTIIYAIVGIVVAALAQFIVHFVLTKVFSP